MDLSNSVVIVTGGAQGLGKSFSERFLQKGCKVAILDIVLKEGLDVCGEFNNKFGPGSTTFIKCDITNINQLTDAFEKIKSIYGGIDIVVNNAGIADEANWKKMLDVNLAAVIQGTYLASTYLRRDSGGRGGVVINISSAAGLYPMHFGPVYTASKYGVVGFSRAFAESLEFDMESHGMHVACFCPAFVSTKMVGEVPSGVQLGASSPKSMGVMTLSYTTDCLMRLLNTPNVNGAVLYVTRKGMEFKFPKRLRGSKL